MQFTNEKRNGVYKEMVVSRAKQGSEKFVSVVGGNCIPESVGQGEFGQSKKRLVL